MLMFIRHMLLLTIMLFSMGANASPIVTLNIKGDFETNYQAVSDALEDNRFFVVFEPNIGRSISNFEERWGDDYNRNGFENIRSLVFCNPWYVNQVLNKDPQMSAICPLSVTLLHKDNSTDIHFLRPSQINPESPAQSILQELETDILKALKQSGAK